MKCTNFLGHIKKFSSNVTLRHYMQLLQSFFVSFLLVSLCITTCMNLTVSGITTLREPLTNAYFR